jgi:hypothetical protein
MSPIKVQCSTDGCVRKRTKSSDYCLDHRRRLTHLGEIGPRIPCSVSGCRFFAVRGDLCTNCHARKLRQTPRAKDYERQYRRKYLSDPERRERTKARRSEYFHKTGYYQTPRYRARKRQYYTSEHGRRLYAARRAQRRAQQISATPPWLGPDLKADLKQIYRMCPPDHHVDHVIPLVRSARPMEPSVPPRC